MTGRRRSFFEKLGTRPQSYSGRGNRGISRESWDHPFRQAGGNCRSDELPRVPGGEVDDRCFRAYGRRRDQEHLIETRRKQWNVVFFLVALTGTSLGVLLKDSFAELATRAKHCTSWRTGSCSRSFRDFSSRGFRKHSIRAPLWKGTGHSDGARLPAHKPDVAIPRAQACRQSHGDLRRPARLRPKRDTAFHGRPLSLFKARNGKGTG